MSDSIKVAIYRTRSGRGREEFRAFVLGRERLDVSTEQLLERLGIYECETAEQAEEVKYACRALAGEPSEVLKKRLQSVAKEFSG